MKKVIIISYDWLFFNTKLSKCENGSKIKYNEKDKIIDVYATKANKCYAYFDKDALGSACRGENLAECFVKNYKKDETIIYHDGLSDYTGMKNYSLEAEDLSYRYSGASNKVNNYVCLDGVTNEGNCQSNEDLYRIIGIFKNEDGIYETKLIKSNIVTNEQLGTTGAYNSENTYFWNNKTSMNNWAESDLNSENLNNIYYNYMLKKNKDMAQIITKHSWYVAGYTGYNIDAKLTYNYELGKVEHEINYPVEEVSVNANIGLMYVSDYMYAASSNYWNLVGYAADASASPYGDYRDAKNNNWMFESKKLFEWTITRDSNTKNQVFRISLDGLFWNSGSITTSNRTLRPCFYLNASTKLLNGAGSIDNPYRLTI